jgi:transposase-like protein
LLPRLAAIPANLAGLRAVNVILKLTGTGKTIKILQVEFLNNILEQDHHFIKRISAPKPSTARRPGLQGSRPPT